MLLAGVQEGEDGKYRATTDGSSTEPPARLVQEVVRDHQKDGNEACCPDPQNRSEGEPQPWAGSLPALDECGEGGRGSDNDRPPAMSSRTSLRRSVGAEPLQGDQVSTYLLALPAKTPTNHHPSHLVPGWATITNSARLEACGQA